MLELYHWEPNGSALKTLVCLHEKQLDFVSHYVDLLAFEHYRPAFLARNPLGQVPVLVHDGKSSPSPSSLTNT
jgi:glutathione S-transferase